MANMSDNLKITKKGAAGPKISTEGESVGGRSRISFTVSKFREGARGPKVTMPTDIPTTKGPASAVPSVVIPTTVNPTTTKK
jgi:hypothetical protein